MINDKRWIPHKGQQVKFLSSPAYEALFGGSAGPGKTDCLVQEALRQIENPKYNAILFRRVFPSLKGADGMIARSRRWYPHFGGEYNASDHVWKFPSGAKIYFGHMQHERSRYLYQGAQFAFIGFDELTEFYENQYLYMMTRNRAPKDSGLRVYIRSATNPGMMGHNWVKKRFITKGIHNTIKFFKTENGKDIECDKDDPQARSRAFYPAVLSDNPSISNEYKVNLLNDSDDVQRERLLFGNWDIEYDEGLVYSNFSSANNISYEADYRTGREVFWGIDDGYAEGAGPGTKSYHPRVVIIGQINELGGIDIFDEYVATGVSSYEDTYNSVIEMGYPKPETVFIDSSAAMFKGLLIEKGLTVLSATHKVHEGIRNLRNMICDGSDMRLIRVNPRCEYTIFEFGNYRANDNVSAKNGELVPHKYNDHAMDAIRYMAWHLRYEV